MAGMTATTGRQEGALNERVLLRPLRPVAIILGGVIALLFVGLLTLKMGAVSLTWSEVFKGLTGDTDPLARNIVWQIRFPRLLDGMLIGAALAVSGSLLQGVTRNPLADPTILGVTAAAGLASAIAIVANPQIPQWGIAMACVGGGLAGAGILYFIAYRGAVSPVRLALAGVALSALFGAAIVGLLSSSRTFLQTSLGFLAGGLYGSEWRDLRAMLPYLVPGFIGAVLVSGRLNILSLGDDVAAGLGVMTDRTRLAILAVVGILTAAAVATAGLVSFVGLVCPHLARYTVGGDNRVLIPVSALYGALLVSSADLVAKLLISPSELPMGIITAGVGAPFLLYLVRFRE